MDLKVVCQKNEANEKNAPGPFIYCRGKTPGTNRLKCVGFLCAGVCGAIKNDLVYNNEGLYNNATLA